MACGLTTIADDGNGSVIEERFRNERWTNDNGKMGEKRTGNRVEKTITRRLLRGRRSVYSHDTTCIARTI